MYVLKILFTKMSGMCVSTNPEVVLCTQRLHTIASVFSPGPFSIGDPLAFSVKNPLIWYWVWLKSFEVTSIPHPPP